MGLTDKQSCKLNKRELLKTMLGCANPQDLFVEYDGKAISVESVVDLYVGIVNVLVISTSGEIYRLEFPDSCDGLATIQPQKGDG